MTEDAKIVTRFLELHKVADYLGYDLTAKYNQSLHDYMFVLYKKDELHPQESCQYKCRGIDQMEGYLTGLSDSKR